MFGNKRGVLIYHIKLQRKSNLGTGLLDNARVSNHKNYWGLDKDIHPRYTPLLQINNASYKQLGQVQAPQRLPALASTAKMLYILPTQLPMAHKHDKGLCLARTYLIQAAKNAFLCM